MTLPFEFVIDGPPVSQQARRRHRIRQWTQEVRNVARQYWLAGELPETGSIMVTITYFFDSAAPDVDNIPKPMLDALNGLVYLDDEQVTDILCRKRNLNNGLRIENLSSALTEGLSRGNDFLHVLVEESPDQQEVIY
ncbi:MAG: RusA family crossover junction endodeoxyribonuclease [Chloroflexi bacterium]|nr:RusA family crossover junction endodeoxyribonuclease [Chloroflexota bacterium]